MLAAGATHVGWKLGVGERERIGGSIAVGHLTSATRLGAGATYHVDDAVDLRVDVELAVELRTGIDARRAPNAAAAALGRCATALEVVDLDPALQNAEAVVAENVFHRAFAFGAFSEAPRGPVTASARVAGRPIESRKAELELVDRLLNASRVLEAVGERLRGGDRVLTGSIVQVPIEAGCEVEVQLAGLGSVAIRIAG